MANVIVLTGIPEYPPEVLASEVILPGQLLEFVPTGGDTGQLRKHATAQGSAATMFAVESLVPSLANSQVNPIDFPYADGDSVRWCVARPGNVINALVPAAAPAIVRGDFLVSNGDGTIRKNTTGTATHCIVAIADEALNNSGGGTTARIRARVI